MSFNLDEYRSLREDAGAVELAWRGVIEMTGRDRARFLHGMCTNDITGLRPGHGCMAAVVNRQGKMVAEIVVRATETALLLEVDRSNLQATMGALARFVVADDVSMKESGLALLGVYGPRSREGLGVGELANFHFVMNGDRLVSRNAILGGYEILSAGGSTGRSPATAVGVEAFEVFRIEAGFPRWGIDMGPDVLPMEAGLEPIAISYSKGCYIGQEVIQRVKTYSEPPRRLVHLAFEGAAVPAPGAKIVAGGQEVGHVTSAALSPASGRAVALGYVRKEHQAPGTRVAVDGAPAAVGALPWQARLGP